MRKKNSGNLIAALTALSGAIAVIAGAYGAHAASGKAVEWLRTGAEYQMIHALAGLYAAGRGKGRGIAALFLLGAAVFSGTLYAMAFGAPRWLGAVTPLGGLGMILAWIWLSVSVLRGK
ncbi:MAG: hypothetical protein JWR77_1216 [Rhizorhabdus sp.]|nr:hypothetical protein [Rhizorhabdus sp.]